MYRKSIALISFVLVIGLVNTTMAYVASDPNDDPNWPDQNDYKICRSLPPTIDGIISPGEWDKAEWILLDEHESNPIPNDVPEPPRWANVWSKETNLIYCVVQGIDTEHVFRDAHKSWEMQDDIEVHFDANDSNMRGYDDGFRFAQQYRMGPTTTGGEWVTMGMTLVDVPHLFPSGFVVGVDGDVITYEMALTPYSDCDMHDYGNSIIKTLQSGDLVGLDISFVTADGEGQCVFHGEHGQPGNLWRHAEYMLDLELVDAMDTTVAHVESPADNETYVSPEVTLNWMAGDDADEHVVYFGTSFEDVNNGAGSLDPEYIATLALESNSIARTVFYPAGELQLAQTYYWRIDEVNGLTEWKGNVWNFVVDAGQAKYPDPADETPDVSWTADGPTLSWTEGLKALTSDVYFGTSYDAVRDAGPSDSEHIADVGAATSIARSQYHPSGSLDLDATYYWRIDSLNPGDERSPWTGEVWSFTLKNHLVLDDFESYTSEAGLRAVWKDKSTQAAPTTQCQATVSTDPAKMAQSMKLNCTNFFSPYYSEVRQTFTSVQDWSATSASGVKALSLWCYGDDYNADYSDYLYVWLEDSAGRKAVQITDPEVVRKDEWTEVNLALSDFTSPEVVDLSQISTIAIGLGQHPPARSGILSIFIDDVRLYIPRCVPGRGGAGDVSGDCVTNYKDLKYVSEDWGISTWDVEVIEPVNDPCLWYKFDSNGVDSSVNGYDGTIVNEGDPYYAADRLGDLKGALMFDGFSTYVDVPVDVFADMADANGEAHEITVSLWYYGEPGSAVRKTHRHLFFGENPDDHAGDPNNTWETRKLNLYFLPPSSTVCVAVGSDPNEATTLDSLTKIPKLEDIEGQWNHWAITKDCNTGELDVYLNGALWLGGTGRYHPISNIALFWIGTENSRDSAGNYRGYITGNMDDFRIYDYALSQGEVCSLAGMTVGSTYTQPMQLLLKEETINTNIYDDYQIDFKDFAMLATTWLDEVIWP